MGKFTAIMTFASIASVMRCPFRGVLSFREPSHFLLDCSGNPDALSEKTDNAGSHDQMRSIL
jgi:hypothetical protein